MTNEFRVGVTVPEAWKVLTDIERIAPMLPGAQLQEVEGDEYRGVVKVKVGPITAQYKGTATFVEQDPDAGKVVLKASGRDTRGQGQASALITATMTPDGDATLVSVVTELTVTGKVAQFGRGVMAEVSAKLIGQFVDALEADLQSSVAEPVNDAEAAADEPAADEPAADDAGSDANPVSSNGSTAPSSGPRRIESPEAEPLDLLAAAGGSTIKRVLPALGVFLLVLLVLGRRRRRARRA